MASDAFPPRLAALPFVVAFGLTWPRDASTPDAGGEVRQLTAHIVISDKIVTIAYRIALDTIRQRLRPLKPTSMLMR